MSHLGSGKGLKEEIRKRKDLGKTKGDIRKLCVTQKK